MDSSLFDYQIPDELIAQHPVTRRDESRLLLVDRDSGRISHHEFSEFPDLLPARSAIFRNDVSVLKARLRGLRPGGGSVECLLLQPETRTDGIWWCLLRPGRRFRPGATFGHPGEFDAEVLQKSPGGEFKVQFRSSRGEKSSVEGIAERVGEVPLPPYIRRHNDLRQSLDDAERYQTVYADPGKKWAAAAPTAGFHFTEDVLSDLERREIPVYDLTLRIGLGTFRPISDETVESHTIHTERYWIPAETRRAMAGDDARQSVAVGTTAVRAIEDFARKTAYPEFGGTSGTNDEYSSDTSLFIYPPAEFRMTDNLLTNFHLPRSTLMCLVAAFLTPGEIHGINWLKEIYLQAIRFNYRFFSYGDAMLIR